MSRYVFYHNDGLSASGVPRKGVSDLLSVLSVRSEALPHLSGRGLWSLMALLSHSAGWLPSVLSGHAEGFFRGGELRSLMAHTSFKRACWFEWWIRETRYLVVNGSTHG